MFARPTIILVLVLAPWPVWGQAVLRDDFEGPQIVLQPAGGDARAEVLEHARVGEGVHSGRWCEHLALVGNNGTCVYYSYPVRPARVIAEYTAGIWLKADRAGLQIAARVVLPRTAHPDTGKPLTTLVRGTDYRRVGNWELLRVDDVPRLLAAQVPMLRAQFGPQVDSREAYVDLLLLNVYGGPGTTRVWIDDFELGGVVEPSGVRQASADEPYLPAPGREQAASSSVPPVSLRGQLLVGREPFFPRIIEHRGESLAYLQSLGFNCVRLAHVPTAEVLSEAARLGLWLVAPPPAAMELAVRGPNSAGKIDAVFDPVLAWDLGSALSTRELEPTRRWAELLRKADPRERPIVCHADSELESYTRPPFKVLLAHRTTLGTSLALDKLTPWLAERTQLARAAAPLWATVPTQPTPQLVEQMRLVSGFQVPVPVWQEAQIRSLAFAALAGRARGLCFTSETRLDAPDPATRARGAMLALLNLELELIERWPAAGNSAPNATSSDAHTTGAVLETDLSRLLLPIYSPPGGQFVMGTQAATLLSFKVAGVPEGVKAYEVSPVGLRPLRADRKAGGTQVVLDDYSRDSLVVFTQDPRVLQKLKTVIDKNGRRAAQIARDLAAAQLGRHDIVAARLGQVGRTIPTEQEARVRAEKELRECAALLEADFARAYGQARHVLQLVRQIERVHWEQAAQAATGTLANPLVASFETLPELYRFLQEAAVAPKSGNRLAQGACEDLNALLAAGWQHFQHRQQGIATAVSLSPQAAHSGSAGLLLTARPADPQTRLAAVETPPVWVTTAPVAVVSGDVVQVQAWVKIDKPIAASVDGLLVIDSQSGQSGALRLSVTQGWQQVTMIRGAARSGPMAVTFALAGLGEAAIDDVTIEIIQRPRAPVQQARAN